MHLSFIVIILNALVVCVHCRSIDVSEDVDGYWLTGLMDNREYHVMICAMNINGCGEQSSLVDFVTPLSLPGQ